MTTKKFQLVSKYANYPTWDEKQNAPYKSLIYCNYLTKFNSNRSVVALMQNSV